MKRIVPVAAVVFCLAGSDLLAQNGGIRGSIVDENGQPVQDVEITLEFLGGITREVSLRSDDNGTFVRMGIRLGDYRMTLRKAGYQELSEDVKIPAGSPLRVGSRTLAKTQSAPDSDTTLAVADGLGEHFETGNAAVEAGDYAAAIAAFEQALEIAPDSPETHFNLGVVHRKMDALDDAIEHFRKATEANPQYYEAYVEIGDIESAREDWSKTVTALSKAVEIRPDSTDALFNLGGAAMNLTDLERAKKAFQQLVEVDPSHAAGHYQLGMIAVNQTDNAAAIVHLEKSLELEPEGPNAPAATGILSYLKEN